MSSSTTSPPLQRSVTRKLSQVYVEIPLSSHKTRIVSCSSPLHVDTHTSNRKENAPLQAGSMIQAQDSVTSSPNRKRKLSESHTNINMGGSEDTASILKKAKVPVDETAIHKPKAKTGTQSQPQQVSEEFPNGWFYCHQCSQKRDLGRKYASFLIGNDSDTSGS